MIPTLAARLLREWVAYGEVDMFFLPRTPENLELIRSAYGEDDWDCTGDDYVVALWALLPEIARRLENPIDTALLEDR